VTRAALANLPSTSISAGPPLKACHLKARQLMQVVYSLTLGGSERLACDLAMRLDHDRVRSGICALTAGGPLAKTLEDAAIPFYVIGCPPGIQWGVMLKLYRLFRANRIDVVQTHHIKQLFYSGLGARMAGAALVHVEHEYFTLRKGVARRGLRMMALICDRIVVVGDEIKTHLVNEVGLPPSKVTVIHNGIDVGCYMPWPRVPREALGLRPDVRLIGHVGRLEPEKDQASLLHSFRMVANTHPHTRLVIIGDGSQRVALERLGEALGIAGRVDFFGFRQDVADFLPHLELFVLSSLNEGLPLSMLEAMACARPVVATALGEIPRVIRDGVNGVTVPPADPAALAHAITAVLEHPEQSQAMGVEARRLVEEQFSLARTVEQYQALYDSLPPPVGLRPPLLSGPRTTPTA